MTKPEWPKTVSSLKKDFIKTWLDVWFPCLFEFKSVLLEFWLINLLFRIAFCQQFRIAEDEKSAESFAQLKTSVTNYLNGAVKNDGIQLCFHCFCL